MGKMYVSVEIENLKQGIVDAVNNSPLPYCLKQVAVDEVARAIREAAKQEYEHDVAEMEKDRKESESKKAAEKEPDTQNNPAKEG